MREGSSCKKPNFDASVHPLQAFPCLWWLTTCAVCQPLQQCVRKQGQMKRERKMRSGSSEWKAEEAGGVVSQASPRCRYNPEWIVRGQFVTGCPTDYFLPRSEAREKEKKQNSLTTSYNGPCCMCPPLLPWPITKSHRVIILNYCCKTSVARRPPKHIHHVARERVSHSRPPWDPSSQDDC